MPDETLICIDCQNPFEFTEGEKQFFKDRNLQVPKRCKDCRAKRRAQRSSDRGERAPSDDSSSEI